jgi:uncharacterized Fe-S radical SAM superfamily protein PflX
MKTREEAEKLAESIVDAIEGDISGRSGIGDELHEIDEDIRTEIRDKWKGLILNLLSVLSPSPVPVEEKCPVCGCTDWITTSLYGTECVHCLHKKGMPVEADKLKPGEEYIVNRPTAAVLHTCNGECVHCENHIWVSLEDDQEGDYHCLDEMMRDGYAFTKGE